MIIQGHGRAEEPVEGMGSTLRDPFAVLENGSVSSMRAGAFHPLCLWLYSQDGELC